MAVSGAPAAEPISMGAVAPVAPTKSAPVSALA